MNVYDFDNTIYRGDSTFQFVLWLYVHRPLTLLSLPRTMVYGLLYGLHIVPKLTFKENLYHMFVYVKDMDEAADTFVNSHMDRIKQWYMDGKKEDDVVISASPEFMISRFCRKLGIKYVMASHVDMHSGKYSGINCHGIEKVRRYQAVFADKQIHAFYSDSLSDSPLAALAKEAYVVKGDALTLWPSVAIEKAKQQMKEENISF